MRKRTLGGTGIEVSEIGLGTWGLGGSYGEVPESVARSTIEAAREAGITTFDLAPLWGRGKVESLVGEVLEKQRDEVVLVGRGGARWSDEGVEQRWDSASLRADCEGSLKRLRTDYIDVWLLHDPPEEMLYRDDTIPTVKAMRSEGKIRAWGVSTSDPNVARMALSRGAEVLCVPYNLLLHRLVEDLAMELAHAEVSAAPPRPVRAAEPAAVVTSEAKRSAAAVDPATDSAAAPAPAMDSAPATATDSDPATDPATATDSAPAPAPDPATPATDLSTATTAPTSAIAPASTDTSPPVTAGPTTGAGLLIRSPLFHGLLSGRWTEYRQFAEDDHRRSRWTSKALTLRVRQMNPLRALVAGDVRSMTSAALRFVLANPRVGSAFLGARRPVQISPAPGLAGEPPYLSPEALARVAEVASSF